MCVVLAAGIGRRLHARKVMSEVGGRTLLARALEACGERPVIVVASPQIVAEVPPAPNRTVVVNDAPERGMTHSLRLADAAAPPEAALAILLADMPFVDSAWVDRVIGAWDPAIDVVSPERDGTPAHPAILGPGARRLLAALPDGDSLRTLRANPDLRRRVIPAGDPDALIDVDSDETLARARQRAADREP